MSSLADLAILGAIIVAGVLLIYVISKMVRKPKEDDVSPTQRERFLRTVYPSWGAASNGQQGSPPIPSQQILVYGDNFCPYCGKKDLHGTYCAHCGKKIR